MAELVDLSDANFDDQVVQPGVRAIVDFWSEDCAPCRVISPILKDLADRFGDEIKIFKVNVYDNPAIAARFGVRSMPTILAMRDGKVVESFVGARPKAAFDQMAKDLLA